MITFWLIIIPLILLSTSPISNRPGCPDNAICTQKAGKRRLQFVHTLTAKNKIDKKIGIPLEVWTKTHKNEPLKKKDDRIHYDSPCSNHNTDKKSYLRTQIFASDFQSLLKKNSGVIVRQGYLLQSKRIVSYPIPRGDSPLYIKKGRIHLNRLFEGEYYSISIGSKGDVRMEPGGPLPSELPRKIACPKPLLDRFSQENIHAGLYSGSYCLKIPHWPKGHAIFLLGQTCFN